MQCPTNLGCIRIFFIKPVSINGEPGVWPKANKSLIDRDHINVATCGGLDRVALSNLNTLFE
jgi:hypothetical protein